MSGITELSGYCSLMQGLNGFEVGYAMKQHDKMQRFPPATSRKVITGQDLEMVHKVQVAMLEQLSLYSKPIVIDNPHKQCIAKESDMQSVRKYMVLVFIGVSCGLAISLPNHTHAGDSQGSLTACQNLKNDKKHYQYLRRKGGSSSQMEYWRKRMREIEDSMSAMGCRKHRNKLK